MRWVIFVALLGAALSSYPRWNLPSSVARRSLHDSTKCRENGKFDNDCCTLTDREASCADGYEKKNVGSCIGGMFGNKYECKNPDDDSRWGVIVVIVVIVIAVIVCIYFCNQGKDGCCGCNGGATPVTVSPGQTMVAVPAGMVAGQLINVQVNGQMLSVTIPPGVPPGGQFAIQNPPAQYVAQAQVQPAMQIQMQPMGQSAPPMAHVQPVAMPGQVETEQPMAQATMPSAQVQPVMQPQAPMVQATIPNQPLAQGTVVAQPAPGGL